MAENPRPADDLKTMRTLLVEERRRIVRIAVEQAEANWEPSNPAGAINRDLAMWGPGVQHLQEWIDAVDRAIADEK